MNTHQDRALTPFWCPKPSQSYPMRLWLWTVVVWTVVVWPIVVWGQAVRAQTVPAPTSPGASPRLRQPQVHQPQLRKVDQRRAALAGIRLLGGRHLTLYTDVPSSPAVDQLPAVFDAAVPQWTEYFHIDRARLSGWRMQGYLMADRELFAQLHLLPETNTRFENGYAQGHELWLMEQPSDYYRRHLLLHEGTHGFMWTQLGGCGAPWYMEGMAELCATHRWDGKRLLLRQMPANREEVPMWGRIKLIQDAYQQRQAPGLTAVLQLGQRDPMRTTQYAWCWALVKLLDTNPRFQTIFRQLSKVAQRTDFQDHFHQQFRSRWSELNLQWRSLVSTLEFGHDFVRMAIGQVPIRPLGHQAVTGSIGADRGWQSTGWLLRAGQPYRLTAKGRFMIARTPGPPYNKTNEETPHEETWPSEPGGITLQYHAGQPLGKLFAALVPPAEPAASTKATALGGLNPKAAVAGLWEPLAVGLGTTLTPQHDAVLYLRVNDSSARLAENGGSIEVAIELRAGQ